MPLLEEECLGALAGYAESWCDRAPDHDCFDFASHQIDSSGKRDESSDNMRVDGPGWRIDLRIFNAKRFRSYLPLAFPKAETKPSMIMLGLEHGKTSSDIGIWLLPIFVSESNGRQHMNAGRLGLPGDFMIRQEKK